MIINTCGGKTAVKVYSSVYYKMSLSILLYKSNSWQRLCKQMYVRAAPSNYSYSYIIFILHILSQSWWTGFIYLAKWAQNNWYLVYMCKNLYRLVRVWPERSDMMKKMVNKEKNKNMDASTRDALCDVMYEKHKHKNHIT